MRKIFSVVAFAITVLISSLPNIAMAGLIINNYQLNTKEVALDATDVNEFLGPGTLSILDDPDHPLAIQVSIAKMDTDVFIISTDLLWTFALLKFQFSEDTCYIAENKCEVFSNNGNYLNGAAVFGGELEIFPVAKTAEAPEPSTLALLILALASLVFARHYKSVRLSRIPARS